MEAPSRKLPSDGRWWEESGSSPDSACFCTTSRTPNGARCFETTSFEATSQMHRSSTQDSPNEEPQDGSPFVVCSVHDQLLAFRYEGGHYFRNNGIPEDVQDAFLLQIVLRPD